MKVHKLTLKEARKIADNYSLGKVEKVEPFGGGAVNFNYELKTSKGIFVIRIFGSDLTEYKRERIKLEKEVLLYLEKKGFPYDIPVPLKNKFGRYYSKIGNKNYWIYRKLEGEIFKKKFRGESLKELAKAIAIYHKYISNLKVNKKGKDIFSLFWLNEKYSKLEKRLKEIKSRNKTDNLVKKNFPLFKEMLEKLNKMDFKINLIVVHDDLTHDNLLFKKGKLTGIIDFDSVKIAPRVEDVAYSSRLSCIGKRGINKKTMSLFLKEYERIVPLTKDEKALIIPLIIRSHCVVFWWIYAEMKKMQDKKYWMLKWSVDQVKALEKELR
jgi:homoserine kinase type II